MVGIIKNGNTDAYPFTQTISGAKSAWYKNYSLAETWPFSYDPSPGLQDPNDKAVGYKYTTIKYLFSSDYNQLRGTLTWAGNGVIPYLKNLTFDTDIIF